ncbi:MAG: hypothetical protein K9M75_01930 [Phycisphaerae bacterium]|nr:hypothetical protein [Phycisphaerae bacterium]
MKKPRSLRAFSLIEITTVLVIYSMIMISTLAIFNRVRKATASINARLDKEDVADEILQRIAEDLDRLAAPGFDTMVTINNKFSNGCNISQLIIENKIYDKDSKPQTFEKIVWQSQFDEIEKMQVLYRHHGGLNLEDKILDGELQTDQSDGTEIFVPICWSMSLFEIVVPKENAEPLTRWTESELPKSVAIKISFAEPVENFDGTLEIPQDDIITRNIAIDRTRKMKYVFEKKDFTRADYDEDTDPNDVDSETGDADKKDSKSEPDDKKTGDTDKKETAPGTKDPKKSK